MKLKRRISLSFFFVAPPVVALALTGVWLSLSAGVENLKQARVSDQVIRAVARARAMRIRPDTEAAHAQNELLKRLAEADGERLTLLPSSISGAEPERAIANPWGKPTRLIVYPAAQAIRLELILSRSACLKMLQLYAEDAASMGLQRVDAREQLPSALWRLVYEQAQGSATSGINEAAIQAGCGEAAETTISMTFGLIPRSR